MDLLRDKIKPIYLKLLYTSIGSALITSIFAIVDAMMVGNYHGPDGTASLAVFNPVWSFVYSLAIISSIGGSVLYAKLKGEENSEKANEYFTITIIFGIFLSIIAFLIIVLFEEPLFRFFGADDTLLNLASKYLVCIKYAIPFCIFSSIFSSFLRNDNNPFLATLAVIIGGIFNGVGDYLFVFTFDMGIFGAGLATSVGLVISTLIMMLHFFKKNNTLKLVKPTKVLKRIIKITITGFPAGVTDLSLGIISILFNHQIMKYFGTSELAVYGIITQITAFVQCCAYGTGQAAQPIMSQNYGSKNYLRIKECLKYGIITSIIVGIFWTIITILIPNGFVHLFMDPTEEVLKIAPRIIRTYSISYLLLVINIFITYYLQAIMKPNGSLILSILRGVVISGIIIIILPIIFDNYSIWFTMLITEIIVLIISLIIVKNTTNKLKTSFIE